MQVKEQEHKRRALKVRRPWHGFFRRWKLARGKLNRSVRNTQDRRQRHKLHYQCLEDMVLRREQAIQSLRRELETVSVQCMFDSSLYQ